jgi:hypothetical protein
LALSMELYTNAARGETVRRGSESCIVVHSPNRVAPLEAVLHHIRVPLEHGLVDECAFEPEFLPRLLHFDRGLVLP